MKGTCSICGRKLSLRKDGTLFGHGQRWPGSWCEGASRLPVESPISDAEARDVRFAELNDRIWGAGNWVRCSICPHDSMGEEIFHHKDQHLLSS